MAKLQDHFREVPVNIGDGVRKNGTTQITYLYYYVHQIPPAFRGRGRGRGRPPNRRSDGIKRIHFNWMSAAQDFCLGMKTIYVQQGTIEDDVQQKSEETFINYLLKQRHYFVQMLCMQMRSIHLS